MLLAPPGQDSAHIVSPSLVSKKLHLRINDRSQHSQREELQIRIVYIEPIAFFYFFVMLVLAEYFWSLLILPDKFPRHLYFVDKRQSGIKTLQSGIREEKWREIQI